MMSFRNPPPPHTYVRTYVFLCLFRCTYVRARVRTYMRTYAGTHARHACSHVRTHTYVRMLPFGFKWRGDSSCPGYARTSLSRAMSPRPRPSLSAKEPVIKDDKSAVILEDTETDQEAAKRKLREQWRRNSRRYYQSHRDRILAAKLAPRREKMVDLRAENKMQRILTALAENRMIGNKATLDQLGQVFMQRCRNAASRDALARLLAASEDSVGTSASASGSSEAPSGSGGGVPSSAAAARREGSTLRWLGHVSADAGGEPPSKRMMLAGPSEDGKDDNQK